MLPFTRIEKLAPDLNSPSPKPPGYIERIWIKAPRVYRRLAATLVFGTGVYILSKSSQKWFARISLICESWLLTWFFSRIKVRIYFIMIYPRWTHGILHYLSKKKPVSNYWNSNIWINTTAVNYSQSIQISFSVHIIVETKDSLSTWFAEKMNPRINYSLRIRANPCKSFTNHSESKEI